MPQQQTQDPGLIRHLISAALFYWAVEYSRSWLETENALGHYVLVGIFWYSCLLAVVSFVKTLLGLLYRWWVLRPTRRSGSSSWASGWQIWRAGLYNKKGLLVGLFKDKYPVFCRIESSGLVLSPSGGGKTSCFVIPALCHYPCSMLVLDFKKTLRPMTARYRKKKFGHRIIRLSPDGSDDCPVSLLGRYNPMIILLDHWQDPTRHRQLIIDAKAMAKILAPEPDRQSENQYFRNGTRRYLEFVFVYLVITRENPTLADALELLSDHQAFAAALQVAIASPELNGDFARLGKDLKTKIDCGDAKQTESFREGAVQGLDLYSRSGPLAESTSTCNFRFSDLKKEKLTIYLEGDPGRQDVYGPWMALLVWCATAELVRANARREVVLMLDEICNLKVPGLPGMMTLLREFSVLIWLIVQDLDHWEAVYGPGSKQILLSQTEAKILMNNRSHQTCQLISDMLGEQTVKGTSLSLGSSVTQSVSRSVQDGPRRLLTADEIRRMEDIILLVKHHPPVSLQKIGYHEVSPWKSKVGINPLFGKKYKGRTRLWL